MKFTFKPQNDIEVTLDIPNDEMHQRDKIARYCRSAIQQFKAKLDARNWEDEAEWKFTSSFRLED